MQFGHVVFLGKRLFSEGQTKKKLKMFGPFAFGRSYLRCPLIICIESGITGTLVHFTASNGAVDEVPKKNVKL